MKFDATRTSLHCSLDQGGGILIVRNDKNVLEPGITHHIWGMLISFWILLIFVVRPARSFRRDVWLRRYRISRFLLAITPWPVTLRFNGFCCDTGSMLWDNRYPTGYHAFRATTDDRLNGMTDGFTSYTRLSRNQER